MVLILLGIALVVALVAVASAAASRQISRVAPPAHRDEPRAHGARGHHT